MMLPDKKIDEDEKPSMVCTDFPKVEVPADSKVWLHAAYERVKAGKPIDPQQMLVELWSEIPDFDYKSIDSRLMKFGVELTLIGILQIDPDTELCHQTDQVIRFIKDKIKEQPTVERVFAEEVSETLEIPEQRVALIFVLMRHLGDFWNGAGGTGNIPGYTSITIKDEHVKREYLKYERLEPLLRRSAKTNEEQTVNTPPQPEFVHSLLDWKLDECLKRALHWIDKLPLDELKTFDIESMTNAVERFAIAVPVLADKPVRDENMAELEDMILDRKTGKTGHIFLLPIQGDAEWLQEISMQTVTADGHPLAFLDQVRSWIYIKLTISLDDPEGTLKRKLDQRLQLVREYVAYVSKRIINFNTELADKMLQDLNKRKKAIERGRAEAESIGLATAYNPKHAETAIQIERLMERLNARFTKLADRRPTSNGNLGSGNEMSDLHQDALKIAKYMYENKFIGSRRLSVSELRDKTNLSQEDFEMADEYLLQSKIYDGTMGGDAGQRWLTPNGVNFVQANRIGEAVAISGTRVGQAIDIFISHSSKDAAIAKALVLLLRAALNVSADRTRCTSVDGYRLPAGASTDDHLRRELIESKVFLALITKASIESTYVLFELGARWGADLPLAPVLVTSVDKALLRGPLGGLNALACDSRSQILQLVDDIASHLGIAPGKPASYHDHVEEVLASAGLSKGQQIKSVSTTANEIDLERMSKHVVNYFAAKGFKKHVGFESLRKYVNANYSDEMLFQMIDKFPDLFRRVTLRGGKPALALVKAEVRPTSSDMNWHSR